MVASAATALALIFAIYQYNDTIAPKIRAEDEKDQAQKATEKALAELKKAKADTDAARCEFVRGMADLNAAFLAQFIIADAGSCSSGFGARALRLTADTYPKFVSCMISVVDVAFNGQNISTPPISSPSTNELPFGDVGAERQLAVMLRWMYPKNEQDLITYIKLKIGTIDFVPKVRDLTQQGVEDYLIPMQLVAGQVSTDTEFLRTMMLDAYRVETKHCDLSVSPFAPTPASSASGTR